MAYWLKAPWAQQNKVSRINNVTRVEQVASKTAVTANGVLYFLYFFYNFAWILMKNKKIHHILLKIRKVIKLTGKLWILEESFKKWSIFDMIFCIFVNLNPVIRFIWESKPETRFSKNWPMFQYHYPGSSRNFEIYQKTISKHVRE